MHSGMDANAKTVPQKKHGSYEERRWSYGIAQMDYSDYLDIEIMASRKGILPSQLLSGEMPRAMNLRVYTEQEKKRWNKYNHSDKGKARTKRYVQSEKGREVARRKNQRDIISGKNAERCRRYRERKKAAESNTGTMQEM